MLHRTTSVFSGSARMVISANGKKSAGWEIHYVAESRCTSIQTDTLSMLSRKGLARGDWRWPADYSFLNVVIDQSRWLVMRLGRDLVKLRFYFWPIDIAVCWELWVSLLLVF